MNRDTSNIKERIMQILRRKGPSLPVHIATELGISMLFSSAFLSELLSEKKIKISYLRVGSSPVYFIPGQEPGLEKYSHHLKSKEKEAFLLLKEKKFLKDDIQLPAIRVALRAINDFAIPFKKNGEIYWRYFTVPINEFKEPQPPIKELPSPPLLKEINKQEESDLHKKEKELPKKEKPLNIFDKKPKETTIRKKKSIKEKAVRKKQDDKFFNKIKEFLSKKSMELLDVESFSKNEIILKIKHQEKEQLLIAYNKKRTNELDIIKAHKKAAELNLPYTILSKGEPLKKITSLIEAVRNLEGIEKIE
jgi:hypothetical protein